MKTFFSFFIVIVLTNYSLAQKELVNVYNSYSEVYGGMEDGGISRNESYVFVAFAKIEIKDIWLNSEKIILQKGDSLIVNVGKYIPYNPEPIDTNLRAKGWGIKEVRPEDRFKVMKFGDTYYVNVMHPYVWEGIIEYIYKKKTYTSKIKEGFDDGFTGAAP